MAKKVLHGDEARKKLKKGVDTLANAVKVTMGPRGKLVVLGRSYGNPVVTKDGVSVAKDIELADAVENMGAQIIKQAAIKTGDNAGDGTTTATVIAQKIISEGFKNIAAGANPVQVRSGIEKSVEFVTNEFKKNSKTISAPDEIKQVATVSSNNNIEIGEMISTLMSKVGNSGVITVDESRGIHDEIEHVEGMKFDRGYISPYFITNADRQEAIIENANILITDMKISSIKDLLPIIEKLVNQGKKDLVIISEDVDGEALPTLVVNKLRGVINVLAVKAPGFGDRRDAMLEDIAVLTGGRVITEKLGKKLESADISDLGKAKKVISDKDNTIIVGGSGKKEEIDVRVESIRTQIENTTSDYDKEKLQERVGKLTGGVAVFKVGAATEVELKEKKDRIEDALAATRAALEEGVVSGGGVAYLDASRNLTELKLSGDEAVGRDILVKALEEPARRIAENAGLEGGVVIDKIGKGVGYNASTGVYENMLENGIVDPTKVTRLAVQNGASAAIMLLTIDAVVADIPKPEEHNHTDSAGGYDPSMGGMM